MRGKKIVAFLVCALMIASGIMLMPKNTDVRADAYQHPSGENEIGLNTTYVWEMVKRFCNVTRDTDWSHENNIPKGRSWATAGENYTIDNILKYQWENFTNPAFEFQKLLIGPINGSTRLYSNKIVIQNFGLTTENPSVTIPISEMFPIGIGVRPDNDLNKTFGFNNSRIEKVELFARDFLGGSYFPDHLNVPTQFLNDYKLVYGSPIYLDENDEVPENQDGFVFIMNETEDCEDKLDNITDASACILIKGNSFYNYEQADEKQFSIFRVDETNDNLSEVVSEIENGSVFFVDNIYDSDMLVFTNLSNDTCIPEGDDFVGVVQRTAPSDPQSFEPRPFLEYVFGNVNGYYYDYLRLVIFNNLWYIYHNRRDEDYSKGCVGLILSDYSNTTHFMTHTEKGWGWFSGAFSDRWWLPMFSVNKSVGKFLLDNINTVSVNGSIEQEYRCQTTTEPGVISNNFIGYLDVTQNRSDPYVILSNRIDGWWGQTPGDSGVGGAILLGIAKYFNDYNIKPNSNLRFLFTTGEEYGMRGAQHYNDSHANDTITRWIGFDQLGFYYTTSDDTINLTVNVLDNTSKAIIKTIANDTHYVDRTGYGIGVDIPDDYGSEDKVFSTRKDPFCNTTCFGRDNSSRWDDYHRSGENYSEGDSLNHTDRNDVNVTFELAWNVIKYCTVNPDCWFNEPATYTIEDSPYDTDTYNDSINVTVSVKSVLPNDKVRVNATLKSWPSNDTVFWKNYDFNVTSETTQKTFTVTLPPNSTGATSGNYTLSLALLNSTGRINDIALNTREYNDTGTQTGHVYLCPRGNSLPYKPNDITGPFTVQILHPANFTTSATDTNQDQLQYQWDWNVLLGDLFETTEVGPYDSDDNCTTEHTYYGWGPRVIQVRARDDYGYLFDGTPLGWNRYGNWSDDTWSEPFLIYVSFFTDFSMSCTSLSSAVNAQSTTELPSIQQINSTYDALIFGGNEPHSYQWMFNHERYAEKQKTVYYQFEETGDYTVSLNVIDNDGYSEEFSVNVSVVNLSASFNLSVPSPYANPDEEIDFTDTSAAASGYQMTNWTWDFDDGTCSYNRNATHVFMESGTYNVSLTVTDNQTHTDITSQCILVTIDETPPQIQQVADEISVDDRWLVVSLAGYFVDSESGIKNASVNITYPDGSHGNFTMMHVFNTIYGYVFNDTEAPGQYNYTVWVTDYENNTNSATGYSFTIPTPPVLLYATTTPANSTVSNDPWTDVNVTILDPLNTSAFIDWDHSLKGYWPMDSYNDTGVYDNSTYDNFGTFQSGLNNRNIIPGKYGKGLEFDGIDHYVDVGTSNSLDLGSGDFTFMTWEKSHVSSYSKKAMILTNSPAGESWKGYGFGVANHAYLFVSQSSGNNVTVQGTTDVTDNTWHHIAYVNHEGDYSIYVDGAFDANGMLTSEKNITNTQHTYLAYDGHTSNWCFFDGMLDEPQLYNRVLSREEINASYNNGLNHLYHNFTGLPDGTYSYYAHAIDTSGNQSTTETRQVTIDTTPPTIINVNASPHTVGFGYNITISADVIDNYSGVDLVNIQITYPGGIGNSSNHTMTHVTNDTYQYVFNDTWLTGQYNLTIWAVDNSNNSNSSGGHHFHVSVTATISIATLKNSYSGSQYINITDPPNPPEDYTLVGRGLTWNTYYNVSSGENILETYQGPVNYQEDNNTWNPINVSLKQLTIDNPAYNYGYQTGNDRGLFGVYFKPNIQSDWPVAFTYNRSNNPTTNVIRSKLVGVGYIDPQSNWAYQYLQNVQSSQGQTNDNSITYSNVFTGTDVTWSYGNTELKEEITLSNATKTVLQNHPPSQYGLNNQSSYLVFITKLDHQNLGMYNASGMLTGNVTISNAGVDFKDALGHFKCALPLGEAYELNNESMRQKLTYRIVHLNGNTYLLSGLKVSDLNAMTFPVVIDPTLTVYSTSSDGYISNSGTNYNTVRTASSGTVNSSGTYITIGQKKGPGQPATYYIYRGFVFFNTSALPSNAYLDTATLALYKKDDYSTTDFGITIQNGQPTYPHNPLQTTDYNKNYYSGNGEALNTSMFTSGYNAIKMNNLSWINTTGTTKLCLRSSRDISGTTPTGNEYVNVYSNEFLGSCPPKLVIVYRNQSKIKNTGSTNINGYLLIQVQFYNTSQSKWIVDNDTINETSPRTINSGNQLALDTIFNGHVRASDLTHGTGTYRVYTAFRDPDGNILKTNTGVELKAWWQFSKT
ncbi:MAG TPA: hypothetical protein DSN98_00330 [Thermoplasmata archaeon]|jgi:hypothetical protein|nr:MAG TPA: hypothetical protein DSN98_00330 [Thermoplasmata archaeon]